MANNKSAEKRNAQSLVRRSRNRARLSALRTQIKKVRTAVADGEVETARDLLPETLGQIDRTASAGAIHRNAAARRKSRLQRLVNQASGASAEG
ncbi:MAG TPA: 30S ribosomal protein S20 [Thermoanaerobaculia bacterium]|nr:30S ribosomal protein S20 [Thermoanaerobaculia bacterium]